MDIKEQIYRGLLKIIEDEQGNLASQLKEEAVNVEIDKRKIFEDQLLKLAQELSEADKRSALYEVLVSLKTIWEQHKPEKELQEKFRRAFDGEDYQEAERIYRRLAKQELDYIGTFPARAGHVIPLMTEKDDMLLHFNKREITLYSLQFQEIRHILLSDSLTILDVFSPYSQQSQVCRNQDGREIKSSNLKNWILVEGEDKIKAVASFTVDDLDTAETLQLCLKRNRISIGNIEEDGYRLSCYKGNLLLVVKKAIYYLDEKFMWQRWYKADHEITAVESAMNGVWVGHDTGDVIILKNPSRVGDRKIYKGFTKKISNIFKTDRYMLIADSNRLQVLDHTVSPIQKPFKSQCRITQAIILNGKLMMLLANGLLVAREMKQGNTVWQLNMGNLYKSIFVFRHFIFGWRDEGEGVVFELPSFQAMAKGLESKSVVVDDFSSEIDPNAPVKYLSDFVGRKSIIDEVKKKYDAHFIFFGEPRIGKTSLLNVFRETLSEKGQYCTVDMSNLLRESQTFRAFEEKFIEVCLTQHFLELSEAKGNKDSYHYQKLRTVIKKIRKEKNYCVIGLDNFVLPDHFDKENSIEFKSFFRSLLLLEEVCLIIACNVQAREKVVKYIDDLDISSQRKWYVREIPLFAETEVKEFLRRKVSLQTGVAESIYKYIGRFPHLLHLFNGWRPNEPSIELQVEIVAQTYWINIFRYFRELSLNARLLITTCLKEELVDETTSYATFYDKFPFLNFIMPKNLLEEVLDEIKIYGSGLSASYKDGIFKITLCDNALLFYESSKHISWLSNFDSLFHFASLPNQERAHQVTRTFTRITQSEVAYSGHMEEIPNKYREFFYVNKLTEQGLQAIKMPLTTFAVISLIPWDKDVMWGAFLELYNEFEEYSRKNGSTIQEKVSQVFYVLLFDLHGVSKDNIKGDLEGMDRVSILDAVMMRDVIMSQSPQDKASEFIFSQLSIKERSPYTTVGAVPDSLFFGRQMELALIRGLPENIGIFGTRTIGKTSLLRRLHKMFQTQKRWKVYDMDCSRIESEATLLKNFAEKMKINFNEIPNIDAFRKYVTRDAEETDCRYLFLLDEVDRLVEYDMTHDERIFNTFNRLCNETMKNNETAARFILFGFQQMFQQMKNPLSRLYNFMVFLQLQSLDKENAMKLVIQPIENIRVCWSDKKDAEYLVDSCSRHPRLLQAACHALLTILDNKGQNRDVIERSDVDKALASQKFRELCLRDYHDQGVEQNEEFKFEKHEYELKDKSTIIDRFFGKNAQLAALEIAQDVDIKPKYRKVSAFLNDLHRITILTAARLLFEKHKEDFTITDLRNELMQDDLDISPNIMRNVLDQLCLSGNFRLKDEFTIITIDSTKLHEDAEKFKTDQEMIDVAVSHPDVYVSNEATFPKFIYEFGVRIFPKLLVANLGGLQGSEEERKRLIEKGSWKEWLRRY